MRLFLPLIGGIAKIKLWLEIDGTVESLRERLFQNVTGKSSLSQPYMETNISIISLGKMKLRVGVMMKSCGFDCSRARKPELDRATYIMPGVRNVR